MSLRSEGRLEGVRTLLMQVWEKARGDDVFDDAAAIRLANNLVEAINSAEAEWADIRKSVTRTIATAAAAGITAAGPAIAAGHAAFMAGAAAVSSVGIAAWHGFQRTAYAKRYPAAFFMDLRDG